MSRSFTRTLMLTAPTGGELDVALVEDEIESWAADEGGASNVSVDCPDSMPAAGPGATYVCTMESDFGFDVVDVEVTDDIGSIVWQVR